MDGLGTGACYFKYRPMGSSLVFEKVKNFDIAQADNTSDLICRGETFLRHSDTGALLSRCFISRVMAILRSPSLQVLRDNEGEAQQDP